MSHRRSINCPNCGAPLTDFKCDYCRTIVQDFTLMDESKPFYLRFKFYGTIYTFKAGLMSIEEEMSTDSVPTFTFTVEALSKILMERDKK